MIYTLFILQKKDQLIIKTKTNKQKTTTDINLSADNKIFQD